MRFSNPRSRYVWALVIALAAALAATMWNLYETEELLKYITTWTIVR